MISLRTIKGIEIKMYFGDHSPPHFHASYSGSEDVVDIETLTFIKDQLPPKGPQPRHRVGHHSPG